MPDQPYYNPDKPPRGSTTPDMINRERSFISAAFALSWERVTRFFKRLIGVEKKTDRIQNLTDATFLAAGDARWLSAPTAAPGTVNARLSVDTSDPLPGATTSTTLYLVPYLGNQIAIYNGSSWDLLAFAVGDASIGAGGLAADTNYDVFVYDSGGPTLEFSAAWSSDTVRAEALTIVDGVYVKASDPTRLYLGTIRTNGSTEFEDTAENRFVWNNYNRVQRTSANLPGGGSWTVHHGTYAAFNSGAAGWRYSFVRGLDEEEVEMTLTAKMRTGDDGVNLRRPQISLGLDSTTAQAADANAPFVTEDDAQTVDVFNHGTAMYGGRPGIGFHFLHAIDLAGTGGASATGIPAQVIAGGTSGVGMWRAKSSY